jgi:hypothetical protein
MAEDDMITAQLEQVRKIEQNFKSRIGIPSDDDEMIGTIRMQGAQRRWSFADPADPGDPADTSDASASEVYAKCDDIMRMKEYDQRKDGDQKEGTELGAEAPAASKVNADQGEVMKMSSELCAAADDAAMKKVLRLLEKEMDIRNPIEPKASDSCDGSAGANTPSLTSQSPRIDPSAPCAADALPDTEPETNTVATPVSNEAPVSKNARKKNKRSKRLQAPRYDAIADYRHELCFVYKEIRDTMSKVQSCFHSGFPVIVLPARGFLFACKALWEDFEISIRPRGIEPRYAPLGEAQNTTRRPGCALVALPQKSISSAFVSPIS